MTGRGVARVSAGADDGNGSPSRSSPSNPPKAEARRRASSRRQDGVLFLLLAFAGLRRGEAIALTWQVVSTKGGFVRSVPMVPQRSMTS